MPVTIICAVHSSTTNEVQNNMASDTSALVGISWHKTCLQFTQNV